MHLSPYMVLQITTQLEINSSRDWGDEVICMEELEKCATDLKV